MVLVTSCKSTTLVRCLLVALFFMPMALLAETEAGASAMEEIEAKWAKQQQEQKVVEDQALRELNDYELPSKQSQCSTFVVNWNQTTTVQAFIDLSSAYSQQLGKCLHKETNNNVQHLVRHLASEELGTVAWYEDKVPNSIRLIPTMMNFSANHGRCNFACFDRTRKLATDAVAISKKAQVDFLTRWDGYVDANIRPALKGNDPAAYEQNGFEDQLKALRGLYEMYAFKLNESEA